MMARLPKPILFLSKCETVMPFPESPRVIYGKNPLAEVICDLRFPPILRIDAQVPAEFQERIRSEYPIFREKHIEIPGGHIPPEIANIVKAALPSRSQNTVYEFASENKQWWIRLTRESLTLRTDKYEQWECFREHLAQPLECLADVYQPSFFSRIGLRYVNVIQRSKLGLKGREWSGLLEPHIAGEFSDQDVAGNIEHAAREVRVKLPAIGAVMIRHGTALEEQSREQCFIVDSDFFAEGRSEPKDAVSALDEFNRESGHLFRWCIQNPLHQAMEPATISE